MRTSAKQMALGGILAALAVVIMSLGGIIPIATYTLPMICAILEFIVLRTSGKRIAWAWYAAVSVLSLLLGPDKEAAAVFVFLGYYPILKPRMDKMKLPWLWKGLLFNISILSMYGLLIHLLGVGQIASEFEELGKWMTVILLVLGNVTFFLLDKVLDKYAKKGRR